MSYASAGLGQTPAVRVGAAARGDVVLANASLAASKIILQATKKPRGIRPAFVRNKLDAMRQGLAREVVAERRRLVARGVNPDQATFDAMRLAIANARLDEGVQSLKEKAARGTWGAEAFGDIAPNDRATGCAIASTAGTVGGVPVYGTIVGAIVGIGSGIASSALDCTRESREASTAAAQAQANLLAAQQAAAAREAAAGSARTRVYLIGGGAIVAALGIGYLLLS
jgi:hypothetical protein